MSAEVYPAILAHTFEDYTARLELVEASPATWVHVDIMDGQFVPNISVMPHEIMGLPMRLHREFHLMVFAPERYYSDLTVAGADRVILHREIFDSLEECSTALRHASDYFGEVGLAINPETPLEPYGDLPIVSLQCMGIHPGQSGQQMLPGIADRVQEIAQQHLKAVISVDGGVSEDNIRELQAKGAKRFIIASHLFIDNAVTSRFQYFTKLLTGGVYEQGSNWD